MVGAVHARERAEHVADRVVAQDLLGRDAEIRSHLRDLVGSHTAATAPCPGPALGLLPGGLLCLTAEEGRPQTYSHLRLADGRRFLRLGAEPLLPLRSARVVARGVQPAGIGGREPLVP